MIDMTAEQIKLWCEEKWKGPLISSHKVNIFKFKYIYYSGSDNDYKSEPRIKKHKRKN